MATMKDIYASCKNPLDVNGFINSALQDYMQNFSIYNTATHFYESKDTTTINEDAKNAFYVNLYNDIFKNIFKNRSAIESVLLKRNVKIDGFKDFLDKIYIQGKFKTIDQIEDIRKNKVFIALNKLFSWDQDLAAKAKNKEGTSWEYCSSYNVNFRTDFSSNVSNIKHRIYINPRIADVHNVANLFRKECLKRGLPYHFKFPRELDGEKRNDKIIIYVDDDHFAETLNLLNELKTTHKQLFSGCELPPVLTSTYNDIFGIADEPDVLDNKGELYSFNSLRSEIIHTGITKSIVDCMDKLKEKQIDYKGSKSQAKSIFVQKLFNCVTKNNLKYEKLTVLEREKLDREILLQLNDNMGTIIKKYKKLYKESKKDVQFDGLTEILRIQTSNKILETITITPKHVYEFLMDACELVSVFDPKFEQTVKSCILDCCKNKGVDPKTFTFNKSTVDMILKSQAANTEKNQTIEKTI